METHGNPTMEELKKMYPPNTYYISAMEVYNDNIERAPVRSTGESKFRGIQNSYLIYGEQGKGSLYYHGHWAIPCDEHGTPLSIPSKDISNYEIF